jgi:chromosomal replication initiator protein
MDGSSVILSVPNKYVASWLEERYCRELEDSFSRILKHPASVSFHYPEAGAAEKPSPDARFPDTNLDVVMTFDSFHTGPWNRFAFSSALEFAEKSKGDYNPLYIFSGPGLGKTHLLHGIGNRLLERQPGHALRYVTSSSFTSEFIRSWRNDQPQSFYAHYSGLDTVLFDDLHLLSSKPKTQQAFISLFDRNLSENRRMVICADAAPHQLSNISEALLSRVGSGLIAPIQTPDQGSLLSLARKKARMERVRLPEDVLFYVSQNCSDIRGLLKNIQKLQSYMSITGGTINLSTAKSLVKGTGRDGVNMEDIKLITASFFNMSQKDLVSGKKNRTQSYPRQMAMYLARKHTSLSLKEIGEAFGHRDHSTVLYAVRQVEKWRVSENPRMDDLSRIENLLC